MILSKCKELMRRELERLRARCGTGPPGADLDEARAEAFAEGFDCALEYLGKADDLRPAVAKFAAAMEAKLRLNDYKGGWQEMSTDEMLERLHEELEELESALHPRRKSKPARVLKEAADVANFAMMIADNFGGLEEE